MTRVPLILRSPALPPATVETDVRTIDLFPTMLELAGLGEAVPHHLEGTSLIPTIQGVGPSALPVFSEAMLYGSTERSLLEDGFRLLYDEQGPRYLLFDMTEDPAETLDIAGSHPERVADLREELVRTHGRLAADRARRADQADEDQSLEESERMKEALRSLGYIR